MANSPVRLPVANNFSGPPLVKFTDMGFPNSAIAL